MEIRQGSFVRTVVLPQEIDTERIAAKLENGLLTIRLRPTKAIESKSVPVTG
jgi:HSP20 family molecular chaperone IbpA